MIILKQDWDLLTGIKIFEGGSINFNCSLRIEYNVYTIKNTKLYCCSIRTDSVKQIDFNKDQETCVSLVCLVNTSTQKDFRNKIYV